MKQLSLILISCCFVQQTNAQIFHLKDSSRKQPIWQFSLGGYLGTQFLHPQDRGDENYWGNSTTNGFDKGLLLGLHLNIYKNWALRFDARKVKKSGSVGYDKNGVADGFHFVQNGIQLPCLLTYTFHNQRDQELLGMSVGLIFNRMSYQTSRYDASRIRNSFEIDRAFQQRYTSYVVGLSKKIAFTKRNRLVVFGEWEYHPSGFTIYYKTVNAQNHYRLSSARLGLYVTL